MTAWDGTDSNNECLNPCSIFTFSPETVVTDFITTGAKFNNTNVFISFEKFIKVTTEYYIYTEINLIAEIGGYVGLFLGISINQIINLMDFFAAKINFMRFWSL